MKKYILLSLSLLLIAAKAQDTALTIYQTGNVAYTGLTAETDSVVFAVSPTGKTLNVYRGSAITYTVPAEEIDSVAFPNLTGEGIAEDVKMVISGASAQTSSSSGTIDKSYDGNYTTLYHSAYPNNPLPQTLTYNFQNTPSIHHFVYYPRSDGNKNGIFKQIEVIASTQTKSNINLGTFNLPGTASAVRIDLPQTLINPVKIEITVTASAGQNASEENQYASCAEMEFYGKSDDMFDYWHYFTDATCSTLQAGVTQADIDGIEQPMFKQLATDIMNGQYNKEFRTQEYEAYKNPDIEAKALKTSSYGLRDNPTGIYATKDEEIVILAGDTHGQSISVFLQDPDGIISGKSYPVYEAINRFKAPFDGLMYILYYTETGTELPVKLNFVTGGVNGYFDSQKHQAGEWTRLINAAPFRHFDVKGKYATMTFETAAYRQYVPNGKALIDQYDLLVYDEQDFMGLVKYNKQYTNRAHFQVMYGDGYMNASSYRTAYNASTQSAILNVDKLRGTGMDYSEAIWGPAHELGHIHQTRPGFKWIGTTETTNNVHSAYIQTKWTGQCRLQHEILSNGETRYQKAFREVLHADSVDVNGNPKMAYIQSKDDFVHLIPFWQLKLYLIDCLGITDFYKDLYERIRTEDDQPTNGMHQIKFVEYACDAAQLDLTDFFTKWGFLKPLNLTIDDYGTGSLIINQSMIDNAKARIAAKGYPKPPKSFTRITDDNKEKYK